MKTHTIESIEDVSLSLKKMGKKIVVATGFFDLLHDEHKNFLRAAREEGDVLIVGVESDKRAKELKGEGRPYDPQDTRLKNVLSNGANYAVKLTDEFGDKEENEAFIRNTKADTLAVSEHSPHQDRKRAVIEKYGGELKIVLPHNPDVSTTKIADQKKI